MSIFPLCDEQKYIFDVNEAIKSIPVKISFMIEFSKRFSPDELCCAVDKCIRSADVFSARCVVKDARQYMEFLPYQKPGIKTFDFATESEYRAFSDKISATQINNRDKLYYVFVFSIAGSCHHIHFCFNHLIIDGISGLLLLGNIQKVLLDKNEEITWHPYSAYLKKIERYNRSEKYFSDKDFWEDRFLEVSRSEYLFPDVIDTDEAPIRESQFQTSKTLKRKLFEYCSQNHISPHLLMVTVLAQLINVKTGCKCFYFELPIGNRLGVNEKNSIGTYEISPPFIFNFNKYNNLSDLFVSVQKQSKDYYKHKNFDWNTRILSEHYEQKYGRYIPQFCFSYFCYNKPLPVSFATWRHLQVGNSNLPMTLYISDYLDWETMTFAYVYWEHYFTEEEVAGIHKDVEAGIIDIVENNLLSPRDPSGNPQIVTDQRLDSSPIHAESRRQEHKDSRGTTCRGALHYES